MLPDRMKFGIFLAPFHWKDENPTLSLQRDLELVEYLDHLGYDEAWIGEHHSAGWEIIASPEVFIAAAAERTKHIRLGTGVTSLPYHHPLIVADRMVMLDHLTKGRTMLGVGPGALVTDAYMLGIDPTTQRPRMDESLNVIMQLLESEEPVTCQTDWFSMNEGQLQMRPYTQPRFEVAVAAAQSPSGMVAAGKYGLGVLSVSIPRGGSIATNLSDFWKIAEETAVEHNKTVDRKEWRLVLHVFLADTKKEAFTQAREYAGRYQREYFEKTLGHPVTVDDSADKIIDAMVERGAWCVGTPDDLINTINRLDQESGGFGGIMIQATEWGTKEQVFHSYELLARYVMPQFQGSVRALNNSMQWSRNKSAELQKMRTEALEKAKTDYQNKN
jgi:limonene 1,2-monooxygenase|tara:strand:- start:2190 stop:3350 length:1161 start_codon:yes stop_codon:yes gene_type:complete